MIGSPLVVETGVASYSQGNSLKREGVDVRQKSQRCVCLCVIKKQRKARELYISSTQNTKCIQCMRCQGGGRLLYIVYGVIQCGEKKTEIIDSTSSSSSSVMENKTGTTSNSLPLLLWLILCFGNVTPEIYSTTQVRSLYSTRLKQH